MRALLKTLVVLPVLVLFCGVAFAQPQSRQSDPPQPTIVEAPRAATTLAPDAVGLAVDPKTYVIGPEDILGIKTWREPEFTFALAVRPDGKITIPLVGDVQAEGLTPERLKLQLQQALSDYINKPDVTITLMQVNSKKYFITGGVNRPGQYPMVVPIRIFEALSGAGGFRDFANTKDITIIRGSKRIKFNYNEVLKGKKLDQNIFLETGDIINVK